MYQLMSDGKDVAREKIVLVINILFRRLKRMKYEVTVRTDGFGSYLSLSTTSITI